MTPRADNLSRYLGESPGPGKRVSDSVCQVLGFKPGWSGAENRKIPSGKSHASPSQGDTNTHSAIVTTFYNLKHTQDQNIEYNPR